MWYGCHAAAAEMENQKNLTIFISSKKCVELVVFVYWQSEWHRDFTGQNTNSMHDTNKSDYIFAKIHLPMYGSMYIKT